MRRSTGTPYVTIVEILGRNAAWLTPPPRWPRDDCEGVDMTACPDPFHRRAVSSKRSTVCSGSALRVIARVGRRKAPNGEYVCLLSDDSGAVDAFGHTNHRTARYLSTAWRRP
jgi:6-phosphofructokinase 1